jgi:hypothetical protein
MINMDQRDLWEDDDVEDYYEVDMMKKILKILRLSIDLGI